MFDFKNVDMKVMNKIKIAAKILSKTILMFSGFGMSLYALAPVSGVTHLPSVNKFRKSGSDDSGKTVSLTPGEKQRLMNIKHALKLLKINDDLSGNTIGGSLINNWLYRREDLALLLSLRIFDETKHIVEESPLIQPYTDDNYNPKTKKTVAREYTDHIRFYSIISIRNLITWYVENFPNDYDDPVYVLKQVEKLRDRHKNYARHTWLVNNYYYKRKSTLTPGLVSEDVKLLQFLRAYLSKACNALRGKIELKKVSVLKMDQVKRFKTEKDLYKLSFWNLPIWVVDEKGHIIVEIMRGWVVDKTGKAYMTKMPDKYLFGEMLKQKRVKSLAEITGLEKPPENLKQPLQEELFPDYLPYAVRFFTNGVAPVFSEAA